MKTKENMEIKKQTKFEQHAGLLNVFFFCFSKSERSIFVLEIN